MVLPRCLFEATDRLRARCAVLTCVLIPTWGVASACALHRLRLLSFRLPPRAPTCFPTGPCHGAPTWRKACSLAFYNRHGCIRISGLRVFAESMVLNIGARVARGPCSHGPHELTPPTFTWPVMRTMSGSSLAPSTCATQAPLVVHVLLSTSDRLLFAPPSRFVVATLRLPQPLLPKSLVWWRAARLRVACVRGVGSVCSRWPYTVSAADFSARVAGRAMGRRGGSARECEP